VADHETFKVEVLTPEGEVFNDEVTQVSTRTGVGSIGILARHQPLLGILEPTELRLYKSDSDVVRFAQGEGYVQVSPDGVLLLVEEATPPDDLDSSELEEKIRRAEQELESAEEDSEAERRAARDKRRWEAFLAVARGDDPGSPPT
jgi:F-type H+-transporting ATPase subunit epsilon